MSRIDRLIAALCPDGVVFQYLGEIVNILDNLRKPVSKEKRISGPYPYYGANGIQDWVNEYIFDGTYLLLGEDGSVITTDKNPILNWVSGKFWVNNHAHILGQKLDNVLLKFIYYYLQTHDISDIVRGTPPKLNQKNLKSIRIPIPPLEIQQEIVAILDKFTKLEAELEAELETRQRQYKHYRDALLTFSERTDRPAAGRIAHGYRRHCRRSGGGENMSRIDRLIAKLCPDGVEFKALRSLVLRPENIRWADHADAEFQYIDLTSVDRKTYAITKTSAIISENAPSRAQQIVREGDVIFGTTRPMLKRYAIIPCEYDGQICSTGFCVLRPDNNIVLTNFLFHLLGTDTFYSYVEANERGASYPAIPDNLVKKFRIPVPPLEIQQEIVSILDRFDALVNDLSIGLPAEIRARRRQYEYYRDRLLTFREAA